MDKEFNYPPTAKRIMREHAELKKQYEKAEAMDIDKLEVGPMYEKFKEMILLYLPGVTCPSHWDFEEECLRIGKRRLYRTCKKCWEKAINEAEGKLIKAVLENA